MPDRFDNPIIESRQRYLMLPRALGTGSRVPMDLGQKPAELNDNRLIRPIDLHRLSFFDDLVRVDTNIWAIHQAGTSSDGSIVQASSSLSTVADHKALGVQRLIAGTKVDAGLVLHTINNELFRVGTRWSCEARFLWGPQPGSVVRFGWGRMGSALAPAAPPYLYFESDEANALRPTIRTATSGGSEHIQESEIVPTYSTIVVRIDVESNTKVRMTVDGEDLGGNTSSYLPVSSGEDMGLFFSIANGDTFPYSAADVDYIAAWRN